MRAQSQHIKEQLIVCIVFQKETVNVTRLFCLDFTVLSHVIFC